MFSWREFYNAGTFLLDRKTPEGITRDVLVLERITSMLNGNGKLSSVSTTNVCKRDEDVLLRTNALL